MFLSDYYGQHPPLKILGQENSGILIRIVHFVIENKNKYKYREKRFKINYKLIR